MVVSLLLSFFGLLALVIEQKSNEADHARIVDR